MNARERAAYAAAEYMECHPSVERYAAETLADELLAHGRAEVVRALDRAEVATCPWCAVGSAIGGRLFLSECGTEHRHLDREEVAIRCESRAIRALSAEYRRGERG